MTEHGWKMMMLIKAATGRVWEAEYPPAPEPFGKLSESAV